MNITIPAPTGGWNTRDSLAELPPNFAPVMENLVPFGNSVKTRPGYIEHSNDFGSAVETLVTYRGGGSEALLCAAGGDVYNISAGGAGTQISPGGADSFTSDRWETTEFKDRIIFCNGTDAVQDWDGTTWTATSLSAGTISSSALSQAVTHHGRVYYVQGGTQSFWYAAAGAYSGTLTEYDLSEFTTTGGSLLYLISWTRDSGAGVDDLLVCMMDTGEFLVYSGDDPGSATDWQLLGVFRIGKPLGLRSAEKVGGDVLVATVDGYIPLSSTIQEGRYTEQSSFSSLIDPTVKSDAQTYGDNFGWNMVYWPQSSLFIVNVPISTTESVQHARNTTKGGWCKWTGINASQWAVYDDDLYFCSPDGYVYKMSGSSDNGAFIPFKCRQASNYFGNPHIKKQVTAAEPVTNYSYPKYMQVRFHADHEIKSYSDPAAPPEPAASDWNVGEWNSAQWVVEAADTKRARRNAAMMGYALALDLRFKSRAQTVTWYSTHIWFNQAGIV